jgi:hypothetical protein
VIVNGPLGFSITSALKTVAKDTYSVARDPRAQSLVAAAGEEYAPDTTSQVMQVTHNVQDKIRQARGFVNQGRPGRVGPGPGIDPGPPMDDDIPVKPQHGLLLVGGAVGAILLVLLLTK